MILKSSTGGTNWTAVFSDTSLNIQKIFFTNSNTGYAVADSGNIIKTSDGGINWQVLNSQTKRNLNSLYFINDSCGFATGDSGLIIRTMDGGINWITDIINTYQSFSKIFFVNDSIGFALGGNNLYSINLNWPLQIWQEYKGKKNEISVYPNSTTGKCSITVPEEFYNEENLMLRIFDNNGKLIQEQTIEMYEDKIRVNLEAEAKGVYNVTLGNKKKSYSGTIVFE